MDFLCGFTARIRRMGAGTVFSLSVLTLTGGHTPIPDLDGRGVPHLRSGWGYPFPGQDGRGTPFPGQTGGHPHLRSGQGGTTIPGQDGGYPHPRSGVPPQHVPGQDRGTPNWNSIAYTYCAVDSMHLAFMQDDFLVYTSRSREPQGSGSPTPRFGGPAVQFGGPSGH